VRLATPKFNLRERILGFASGFLQAQEQIIFQVECVLCSLSGASSRAKFGSKVVGLSGSFTHFCYFIFWLSPSFPLQLELF
jgi:hypothetical protein